MNDGYKIRTCVPNIVTIKIHFFLKIRSVYEMESLGNYLLVR